VTAGTRVTSGTRETACASDARRYQFASQISMVTSALVCCVSEARDADVGPRDRQTKGEVLIMHPGLRANRALESADTPAWFASPFGDLALKAHWALAAAGCSFRWDR
jgi:hypothetical protein